MGYNKYHSILIYLHKKITALISTGTVSLHLSIEEADISVRCQGVVYSSVQWRLRKDIYREIEDKADKKNRI